MQNLFFVSLGNNHPIIRFIQKIYSSLMLKQTIAK